MKVKLALNRIQEKKKILLVRLAEKPAKYKWKIQGVFDYSSKPKTVTF